MDAPSTDTPKRQQIGGKWVHPAAQMFPMMTGEEALELRKSIAKDGLRKGFEIVLTPEGEILEGRNRLQACLLTGRPPRFVTFDGDDPIAYVMATNLTRRHLSTSDRALLGAQLLPLFEAEAAARRKAAADRGRATRSTAGTSPQLGVGRNAQTEGEDPPTPQRARDQAAAAVNVSPRLIEHAAAVLEQGAPELVERVRSGELAVTPAASIAELPLEEQLAALNLTDRQAVALGKQVRARDQAQRRGQRIEKITAIAQGNRPLEAGPEKYALVYADPAWRYGASISASRDIEEHYPTMSTDEICALPVRDIVTDDALLFLWTTVPHRCSGEAQRVVEAWGFRVVGEQIWQKYGEAFVHDDAPEDLGGAGLGRWMMVDHEVLLWCVRGKPPVPLPSERPRSCRPIAPGEHSAKPVWFVEMIERLYGQLPKIELFCRAPREGWAAWGNQAEGAGASGEAA